MEIPLYEDNYDNYYKDIQFELQIVTVPKDKDSSSIVIVKSDRFTIEQSKHTYIHFINISYVYNHDTKQIYCTTLEHKI